MNSGHPQYEQQPFVDWLSKAKRKFVGATIHNSGRYCVAVMNHVDVYAFETWDEAATFMAGHSYRLYDLAQEPVKPCRTVPDAHDADELRRERREKRAALQQGTSVA